MLCSWKNLSSNEWSKKIYGSSLKILDLGPLPVKLNVIVNCLIVKHIAHNEQHRQSGCHIYNFKNKWMISLQFFILLNYWWRIVVLGKYEKQWKCNYWTPTVSYVNNNSYNRLISGLSIKRSALSKGCWTIKQSVLE